MTAAGTPRPPLLGPEDESVLRSFVSDGTVDCDAILEYLGSFISHGASEGRFTEKDAHRDLGIALWVAYACNNEGDYEHFYTACDWLSGVEDLAKGCGRWYYRYANALMYCGRPNLALEYCERGVAEDPEYPWTWLTLGRLRSHFGDRKGAFDAGRRGLELVPGDYEFLSLMADIETGATIEQMEMHLIDPEADASFNGPDRDEREYESKLLAVQGIVCDRVNLERIKEGLGVSGWSADHPYCTCLMEREGGSLVVTFMMNEAQLSKRDPSSIRSIIDSIDVMDARARGHLENRVGSHPSLYGLSIRPDMGVRLSYVTSGSDDVHTVDFDSDLELLDNPNGGPFAAIVLLREPRWDPSEVVRQLEERWGIKLADPEVSDESLIAAFEGHILAVSLISSPVPGNEASDAAAGNYMWPEGRDVVTAHTAHLIVAMVNHDGDPVECGLTFVKLVDSCLRASDALGVYENDTVYRPEFFMLEAEGFRSREVIPVLAMVWIGMYRTSEGVSAYTVGLGSYARDEMEVLDADDESYNVMNFLYDVVYHMFLTGTVFKDGDTFGFGPEQVLTVNRSAGVSLDGYTLKLQYPGRRDTGSGSEGYDDVA